MADCTLAELDQRLAAMRRISKDPRRPVDERVLARKVIDGYLDRRIETARKIECSPSS